MKSMKYFFALVALITMSISLFAQQGEMQNYRYYDQTGVNVFEPGKDLTTEFVKPFARIGGSFTQQFQGLSHENSGAVELYSLGSGFNLAAANLNIDFQIEDGIRVSLENYMSSRHHSEFWVKGGYIQIDKLPMFNNTDWFDRYFRVKIGHMEINYGDQHFRRTDNGNAIANPFVGNYIMDAFTTEIGGEIYAFPVENTMFMVGMTNGLIKGDVTDNVRKPSIYGKVAYDKTAGDNMRFRLSGSMYMNAESGRNTLFGGDRAGSRFYEVMESAESQSDFSGRVNPGFSTNVTAWQISPFVKVGGLELFGTYEIASGYSSRDPKEGADPLKRSVTQVAVEGLYRFLPREQMYIGARYNTVTGEILAAESPADDLSVNRFEVAAGWYTTKNLLLKVSYVNQDYNNFPVESIFNEGNFNGIMIEASVGF
jgi:hypothetical protein